MFKQKIVLAVFISLLSLVKIYAINPSFTITQKPTAAIIPFGHNGVQLIYSVSYANTNDTRYLKLLVVRDGEMITEGLNVNMENKNLPVSIPISFTEGSHTVVFTLAGMNPATMDPLKFPITYQGPEEFTVTAKFQIKVENNFAGGIIHVGNLTDNRPAPVYVADWPGTNFPIGAIEQNNDNYDRVWNNSGINNSNWRKEKITGETTIASSEQNTTYTLQSDDKNSSVIAGLRKVCNVTVERNNPYGGIVKIIKNGQEYTAPSEGLTKNTVEKNPITLKAEYETENYINYSFQGWLNNATNEIESTNPEYTINPEEHRSYTAVFRGTANTSMMNIQNNCSQAGQRPVLTWTDNPNDNVSYKIYQQMVPANNTSGNYTPSLIASVAKGTQYYQHPTFEINNNPGMDHLYLEVKAYYSTENTLITAGWAHYYFDGLFPEEPGDPASKKNTGIQKDAAVTKYAVANYPNPFNPTTVINYQVPEAGHVTVKVYDVMGKEVTTLVDGAKNKGSYNINFSMDQYPLSSGIYFCRMQAGKNITTTKMILSK